MKPFFLTFIFASTLLMCACGGSDDGGKPTTEDTADFTVMSFNIHYGNQVGETLNLSRSIEVIKEAGPDILILNEVDRNYDPRSNYQDQLEIIARETGQNYRFQKTTWKSAIPESMNKPREFGHAVLSKYPVEHVSDMIFDAVRLHYHGLLETRVQIGKHTVYVYATQLETDPDSRASQVNELLQKMSERDGLQILCGDMNAGPDDPAMVQLAGAYTDAFAGQNYAYTFRSDNPSARIDYIFGSEGLTFKRSRIILTSASDHLPIISEVFVE